MTKNEKDAIQQWLSTEIDVDGHTTPRAWLNAALKRILMDSRNPLGNPDWTYDLAITLVPTHTDIVLSHEEGADEFSEFAFDWKKVNKILLDTIDVFTSEDTE